MTKEATSQTYNNLLLFNNRIVIPTPLCKDVMKRIHPGHQGIERYRMRVRSSVWWPSINKQVTEMVRNCHMCEKATTPRQEPLISTSLPDYPWRMIGMDLFELEIKHYLLVVDYFSCYPEVIYLKLTTSLDTTASLKSIFSRHGIPDSVRTDKGPQYSSRDFSKLASLYVFTHITSSPLYPHINGLAEGMVQTVKWLLRQS